MTFFTHWTRSMANPCGDVSADTMPPNPLCLAVFADRPVVAAGHAQKKRHLQHGNGVHFGFNPTQRSPNYPKNPGKHAPKSDGQSTRSSVEEGLIRIRNHRAEAAAHQNNVSWSHPFLIPTNRRMNKLSTATRLYTVSFFTHCVRAIRSARHIPPGCRVLPQSAAVDCILSAGRNGRASRF